MVRLLTRREAAKEYGVSTDTIVRRLTMAEVDGLIRIPRDKKSGRAANRLNEEVYKASFGKVLT